ncbi:hypothetical protein SELMODRAFT_424294 [Selaginella moellendorffii]|uniref:Uncharacterized protein n=1 Tax=Selaginella moellendorffii TaxID=88036 RepID=D8SPF2_SELML|nr:hypothetical protein SELMODRAFT_424294 [Selaginella moellendorffii]
MRRHTKSYMGVFCDITYLFGFCPATKAQVRMITKSLLEFVKFIMKQTRTTTRCKGVSVQASRSAILSVILSKRMYMFPKNVIQYVLVGKLRNFGRVVENIGVLFPGLTRCLIYWSDTSSQLKTVGDIVEAKTGQPAQVWLSYQQPTARFIILADGCKLDTIPDGVNAVISYGLPKDPTSYCKKLSALKGSGMFIVLLRDWKKRHGLLQPWIKIIPGKKPFCWENYSWLRKSECRMHLEDIENTLDRTSLHPSFRDALHELILDEMVFAAIFTCCDFGDLLTCQADLGEKRRCQLTTFNTANVKLYTEKIFPAVYFESFPRFKFEKEVNRDVEFLLMHMFSEHILEGIMDGVDATVTITWIKPRTLVTTQAIEQLREIFATWELRVTSTIAAESSYNHQGLEAMTLLTLLTCLRVVIILQEVFYRFRMYY